MADVHGLTEAQRKFVSTDHCHICGEKLHKTDEWVWVVADEIFFKNGKRLERQVRSQWHTWCSGARSEVQ